MRAILLRVQTALSKPRNLFAYEKPTLSQMVAGYAAGIILNHPFLEGNKRTGLMLAATFLESNGAAFEATEESVVQMTHALADGKLTQTGYADWLHKNSS